mgnify:CR=1 FL=1
MHGEERRLSDQAPRKALDLEYRIRHALSREPEDTFQVLEPPLVRGRIPSESRLKAVDGAVLLWFLSVVDGKERRHKRIAGPVQQGGGESVVLGQSQLAPFVPR